MLSGCRFPDGDIQFLPIYRDGQEGDLFVVDTTVAIFDPVIIGVPIHLGNGRSLDEYAGCGCHRNDRGSLYVKMATKTSESMKKFILWRVTGSKKIDSFVEE